MTKPFVVNNVNNWSRKKNGNAQNSKSYKQKSINDSNMKHNTNTKTEHEQNEINFKSKLGKLKTQWMQTTLFN